MNLNVTHLTKYPNVIYNTGISILGFSSLANVFMFLFLGNGVQEVFPVGLEER